MCEEISVSLSASHGLILQKVTVSWHGRFDSLGNVRVVVRLPSSSAFGGDNLQNLHLKVPCSS